MLSKSCKNCVYSYPIDKPQKPTLKSGWNMSIASIVENDILEERYKEGVERSENNLMCRRFPKVEEVEKTYFCGEYNKKVL